MSDVRREPLLPPVNSKTSNIRANFENLAKEKEQEDRRKAEAERAQRMARERREQEEARRQLEVSAGRLLPLAGAPQTSGPAPCSPGLEGSRWETRRTQGQGHALRTVTVASRMVSRPADTRQWTLLFCAGDREPLRRCHRPA